jgi:hypothetical protein
MRFLSIPKTWWGKLRMAYWAVFNGKLLCRDRDHQIIVFDREGL